MLINVKENIFVNFAFSLSSLSRLLIYYTKIIFFTTKKKLFLLLPKLHVYWELKQTNWFDKNIFQNGYIW